LGFGPFGKPSLSASQPAEPRVADLDPEVHGYLVGKIFPRLVMVLNAAELIQAFEED